MRWTGEFRALGFYKLDVDGQIWELRHRKRSRTEPEGWYLYGPEGVDVVAEFMAAKLAPAQRAASKRAGTYDPDAAITAARLAEYDEKWDRLLGDVA